MTGQAVAEGVAVVQADELGVDAARFERVDDGVEGSDGGGVPVAASER